jgi:hypothetical protein
MLVTGADQEPPLKILPGLEKYEPPERSKVPYRKTEENSTGQTSTEFFGFLGSVMDVSLAF